MTFFQSTTALARLALLCALWLAATAAWAATPRIGVATMQPGEIFFERFGHNAIVVVDPTTGQATSYNFGFFDPTEPDFVSRFAEGEMRYYLVALPFEEDLLHYRETGRGVSLQWLRLPPGQAQALADAGFRTRSMPVAPEVLHAEFVSPTFVGYLAATFSDLVADG